MKMFSGFLWAHVGPQERSDAGAIALAVLQAHPYSKVVFYTDIQARSQGGFGGFDRTS